MTPTNKLRWLNKFDHEYGHTSILQQWWAKTKMDVMSMQPIETNGEWRDVEVVNEQT